MTAGLFLWCFYDAVFLHSGSLSVLRSNTETVIKMCFENVVKKKPVIGYFLFILITLAVLC